MVNTDDLCDAHEVASILGLSHSGSVFGYLRRYADLPRPVIDLGHRRIALWSRSDVQDWVRHHPRRRSAPRPDRRRA
jgi:glutathione-regulated potassium-efflux system ancillary protein KefG